jgi:hypothetical protein
LFRFNALFPDSLTASVVVATCGRRGWVELLIVILVSVEGGVSGLIAGLAAPSASPKSGTVGSNTNGVEAVRPGHGRSIRNAGSRTSAAVARMPARGRTLRWEVTVAEIVRERRRRQASSIMRSI